MAMFVHRFARTVTVVAVVAAFVVFALPWLTPVRTVAVFSDSQAVGFSNRVAIAGLITVCLAVAVIAARRRHKRGFPSRNTIMGAAPAEPGDSVGRMLTSALVALSVCVVAAMGWLYGSHPYSDAGYFMNSILRVVAGGQPYTDIQSSYGPLMIYAPIAAWRALQPLGIGLYATYYICVAASHVGGLLLTAYVLDRLELDPVVRRTLFLGVGLFSALWLSLGLNYTSLRFIAPYAALVWLAGRRARPHSRAESLMMPTVLVGLAGAWSPEMGIALLAGLLATLGLRAVAGHKRAGEELGAMIAGAGLLAFVLPQGSIGSFLGGSYNLPILPGLPQLLFVGTMLIVAFGVGDLGLRTADEPATNAVGLLICALALVAPALGRADFVHVYWNGLGAFAIAAAVLIRTGRSRAYARVCAAVFVTAMLAFSSARLGGVFDAAAANGSVSEGVAVRIAAVMGKPESEMRARYRAVQDARPSAAEEEMLMSTPGLAFLEWPLSGSMGLHIAQQGDLVPTYSSVLDGDELHRLFDQLDAAGTVVVPTGLLDSDRPGDSTITVRNGVVFYTPAESLTPLANALLFWVPVRVTATEPVMDYAASVARYLKAGWHEQKRTDHYILLTPNEGE